MDCPRVGVSLDADYTISGRGGTADARASGARAARRAGSNPAAPTSAPRMRGDDPSRGKTVFIDPQTNSRYSGLTLRHVSNASVTRIDNQGFTEYARNAFTQSRR